MIPFELASTPRVRIATFSGVIGDRELIDAYRILMADPAFDNTLPDLVDLRPVTRLEVTANGLRSLIRDFQMVFRHTSGRRVAIVAAQDATYGMARMYELLRGVDPPEQIRVFRDYQVAMDWLSDSAGPNARSVSEL